VSYVGDDHEDMATSSSEEEEEDTKPAGSGESEGHGKAVVEVGQ